MATISQITEAVYRGRFTDEMSAGASAAAKSMRDLGAQVVETDTAVTRAGKSATQYVNALDPVTRATNNLARAQRELADAQAKLSAEVAAGGKSQEQADRTIASLSGRVQKATSDLDAVRKAHADASGAMSGLGNTAKLTTRELQALSPQLTDLFVQLSGGTKPLLALIQQGPQMVDAVGGIGRAFSLLRAAITPTVAAVATIGVAVIGSIAAYNAHEGALASLRNRLRSVTEDYRTAAVEVEASARRMSLAITGLGREDAGNALVAIRGASSGLGPLNMRALTEDITDFSRTIAGDFAGATQMMTRLMRDPVAVVQQLADQDFPGLDRALVVTLDALVRGGSRADAFNLALDRIRQQTRGAREEMSPLAKAWDDVTRSMGEFWEKIAPAVQGAGAALLGWVSSLVSGLGRVVDLIKQIDPSRRTDAGPVRLSEVGTAYDGLPGADFARGLAQTESGGNPNRVNGAGYLGLYQFGAARLADLGIYRPGAGEDLRANAFSGSFAIPGFDGVRSAGDFLANPRAQEEALRRHLERLDATIDRLGVLGTDATIGGVRVNRDGLRAVGHLGGEEGLRQFVASGGTYNPGDSNGTRLADYYRAFSITADRVQLDAERAEVTGSSAGSAASGNTEGSPTSTLERALRLATGQDDPSSRLQGRETNLVNIQSAVALMRDERAKLQEMLSRGLVTEDDATRAQQMVGALTRGIEAQSAAYQQARSPVDRYIEAIERSAAVASEAGLSQQKLTERMSAFDQQMRDAGVEVSATDRLRVMTAVVKDLNAGFAGVSREVDRNIDSSQRLTAETLKGDQAAARAAERERAIAEVRRAGVQGVEAQAAAVEDLTVKYQRQTAAEVDRQSASGIRDAARQIEYLEAEARLAGSTADQRERELAALRERQRIQRAGGDVGSDVSQAAVQTAQRLADVRRETLQVQNSWRELENVGAQAFDRIGSAITEAFTQGNGAAINFGNIARAIFSEVIQAALRMAVINPILNAAFGGTRGTIGGLGLGGGSGASAGSGGGLGGISNLLGLGNSAYNAYSGGGGMFSGITTTINDWGAVTGLFATGTSATASSAIYGSGAAAYGGAMNSGAAMAGSEAGLLGSGTLSQFAGGIGIGYGAGSLLGGWLAGDSQARQQNAQIGAGGGAAAGAIVGSIFPVIGTMVGAIVGGLIGGGGGGLIGPGRAFSGGDSAVAVNADGRLIYDGYQGKNLDGPQRTQLEQGTISAMEQLNATMVALGLRFTAGKGAFVGGGESGNPTDLISALDHFGVGGLTAEDVRIQGAIDRARPGSLASAVSGGAEGRLADLLAVAQRAKSLADTLDALAVSEKPVSAFQQQLNALGNQFAPLEQAAKELGFGLDELTAAHRKQSDELFRQRDAVLFNYQQQLRLRELRASNDNSAAALLEKDMAARNELAQFQQQVDALGLSASESAGLVARLTAVQATERATLDARAAAQTRASGLSTGFGQSKILADFLLGQDLSSGSPKSRFAAAQDQFSAALQAAQAAGPVNADLSRVVSAANTLLQANIDFNASGPAGAALQSWVRESVSSLARQFDLPGFTADLTASMDHWGEIAKDQGDQTIERLAALEDQFRALAIELRRVVGTGR